MLRRTGQSDVKVYGCKIGKGEEQKKKKVNKRNDLTFSFICKYKVEALKDAGIFRLKRNNCLLRYR